ncbi:aromatic ring-hydroxylating dioxygenase subunit alpha [Pelagibius sp. Alg239-R121]|uniref:aromatic ring-hydroxylating oxygenase subunit alpha n=1 Tax=Pelagibius sp. Alg239-R121 TaxID=2993448 RepID=UPI0024A68464|nr:aromatic ring-hydroxylating dioxygenase subunit alpha [Pelagibius sp. Alg239-R121]
MSEDSFLDDGTWEYFWHPVCTLDELESADRGRGPILEATLLGRPLAIAKTSDGAAAFENRCPHRSAKLSLGWIKDDIIQCPYHGWRYRSDDGVCIEIPALPDGPIPQRARATRYDCRIAYDLVWVRLKNEADTQIPAHPVWDDPAFKCVMGPPYSWKTHAARRLENFTDLAHFPFVHPETLGNAQETAFEKPVIDFEPEARLRFRYVPASGARSAADSTGRMSPLAYTDYTITLPFGVTLELALQNGERSVLWLWASPIDSKHCRSFWFTCRNRDHDGPDAPHVEMQHRILNEDIDIVESQQPEEIPHPRDEVAIGPDKVSLTYRKCLHSLSKAAERDAADGVAQYISTARKGI